MYRPGNCFSCSAGSNSGTGSITCSSVSGPSLSNISAVVSPRNAPISTIRRARVAWRTGQITRSQNGYIRPVEPFSWGAAGGASGELGARGQYHDLRSRVTFPDDVVAHEHLVLLGDAPAAAGARRQDDRAGRLDHLS